MTKSALHLQLGHDPSPVKVLENLNRTIYDVSDEKNFVTLAYALIDRSAGIMQFATAGHPPGLLYQSADSRVVPLRTPSLGLGIKPDAPYSASQVELRPGDSLVFYTDGVVEETNKSNEQFGQERLEQYLKSQKFNAEDVCSNLTRTLRAFSGKDSCADDVSIVCLTLT
jgi:sigma-B regulation protein RsbU (phosphoserine phosphatase)